MNRFFRTIIIGAVSIFSTGAIIAQGRSPRNLKVAVYTWIPEAAAAVEKLETDFEAIHNHIDLDLFLINPYSDKKGKYDEYVGLGSLPDFDIVEIDLIRLEELVKGKFGGLEKIPPLVQKRPNEYVGGAGKVMKSSNGEYIVPHWVCGNFWVVWKQNSKLSKVQGYEDILSVLDAEAYPFFGDFYGGGTLGEIYADAVLDLYGVEKATAHFKEIARKEDFELLPEAENRIISLIQKVPYRFRSNLSKYHDLSLAYPSAFALNSNSTLLGYSERFYYVERTLQFEPNSSNTPIVSPSEIVVRQFPFSEKSTGTPSWVDGFVIPKGKLKKKKDEIVSFLQFVQSSEGYASFMKPRMWNPASNLLPSVSDVYDDLKDIAPLLNQYKAVLGDSFVIDSPELYLGIDRAGEKLKAKVKELFLNH